METATVEVGALAAGPSLGKHVELSALGAGFGGHVGSPMEENGGGGSKRGLNVKCLR
jgi:hypothetical protein